MYNYNLDDKPFDIDEYDFLFVSESKKQNQKESNNSFNKIILDDTITDQNKLLHSIIKTSVNEQYKELINVLKKTKKIEESTKQKKIIKLYNLIQTKIEETKKNIDKLSKLEELQHLDDVNSIKNILSENTTLKNDSPKQIVLKNVDPINILQKYVSNEEKNRKAFEIAQLLMGSLEPSKWLDELKDISECTCKLSDKKISCDIYKLLNNTDISLKYWQITCEIALQLKQPDINLEKLFENLKLTENFIDIFEKDIFDNIERTPVKQSGNKDQRKNRRKRGGSNYTSRNSSRNTSRNTSRGTDTTLQRIKEYRIIIGKDNYNNIKEYLQNILNMNIFPFYFNNIDEKYLNKKKSDWVNSYKPKRKLRDYNQNSRQNSGRSFEKWNNVNQDIFKINFNNIKDPFTRVFQNYMYNPFSDKMFDENLISDIYKMFNSKYLPITSKKYEENITYDIMNFSEYLWNGSSIYWIDYIKKDFVNSIPAYKKFRKKLIKNIVIYFKLYLKEILDVKKLIIKEFQFYINNKNLTSVSTSKKKSKSTIERTKRRSKEKDKPIKKQQDKPIKKQQEKQEDKKQEKPIKKLYPNNNRNKIYPNLVKINTTQ